MSARTRRHQVVVCVLPLFLSVLSALSVPPSVTAATRTSARNVLYIVSDDLRAELPPTHTDVHAPNLGALAAQGFTFTRAYCNQPVWYEIGPLLSALFLVLVPYYSRSHVRVFTFHCWHACAHVRRVVCYRPLDVIVRSTCQANAVFDGVRSVLHHATVS